MNSVAFEGFSQKTIDFMWGLRLNSNKPWFELAPENWSYDYFITLDSDPVPGRIKNH